MATEQPLCCTTSVALGQRAFNNYNGIGIHLAYSPQAPSAVQLARGPPASTYALQPPPMLAVVLDASMPSTLLHSATQALTQALGQLSPQTRLLLLVVDQVVSIVDLKTPRPQSWVVHGLGSQGSAVLPQLVQAADIRATPLAHCQSFLPASLAALRHHPRQQNLQHHLRIMASAADIALFLLTASMAAWDAQHKHQQQQQAGAGHPGQQPEQQQPQPQQVPMHNARVMVLTGLPNNSCPSAAAAAEQLHNLEEQMAQHIRGMFNGLAAKAASLDIPIDIITGSTAAPAAILFQEVARVSHGCIVHQPQLQPPLAANIAAVAQSRFGWEGVVDVRVPAGVKLTQLSGPIAAKQRLPEAAFMSGSSRLPVTLIAASGLGPAGDSRSNLTDGPSSTSSPATAATGPSSSSSSSSPTAGKPVPSGTPAGAAAGAADAAVISLGGSTATGTIDWSPAAVAVPVLSSSSRFVVGLELSKDWQPGSSFEVQLLCEWTAPDGRRLRQVVSHTVQVSDRLAPFIDGLDVPAVVLLLSQRLVASALGAAAQGSSSGSAGPLALTAVPSKRAVEEGRLAVGMALAHVAQRLGHAHVSRRGMFGFGSQQVWQLPDELIPLALSFYQLQRGPLLNPAAAIMANDAWGSQGGSTSTSSSPRGGAGANATAVALAALQPGPLMYGSWRLLAEQFGQCSPSTALRMVAPWLYVFDANSNQFDVLPPLNLALEPDALAVLDCGSEVIIYVGKVLTALVEGLPAPSAGNISSAPQQQQQQQQQQHSEGLLGPTAAAPANGVQQQQHGPATANGNVADVRPAQTPPVPVPDMAEAAAPAVSCAHQLVRGRVPVPAIHLVEDTAGMVNLVHKLVPLHEDPVALQLLLLPHLRDLSPAQHGYLLDWHRHWASMAADSLQQRQQAADGYPVRTGGARLASAEGSRGQELSFGAWYSSFGVVLKSPAGALGAGAGEVVAVE